MTKILARSQHGRQQRAVGFIHVEYFDIFLKLGTSKKPRVFIAYRAVSMSAREIC